MYETVTQTARLNMAQVLDAAALWQHIQAHPLDHP
jgi:hypothetical protein